MANPEGHVVLGEEEARAAETRYAALEAELQVMRKRNEEVTHGMKEQEEIVVAKRLRVDRRV